MSRDDWSIEVFFDGDCPLCRREVELVRRRDRRGAVKFVDIAASSFDADRYGKDLSQLMDRIHGRLPDGTWVEGVEVFRRMYGAVGFGRLVSLSRLPVVRHGLDWLYERFARNRLRLTGRCLPDGDCRLPAALQT